MQRRGMRLRFTRGKSINLRMEERVMFSDWGNGPKIRGEIEDGSEKRDYPWSKILKE